MFDDCYLVIEVRVFQAKVNSYEFIPVDYRIGSFSPENGKFICRNNKTVLESAKTFLDYREDDVKTFYAFPIKVDKLNENTDESKTLEDLFLEYFTYVKSYEHICVISDKTGIKAPQFCSVKPFSIENPIYNNWELEFSTDRTMVKLLDRPTVDRLSIIEAIKKRIVAQDKQVEQFVTAVVANQKYGKYEGLKNNIMIIGPTGVGKTEMCNSLAKILDIPIIKRDATKYTTTGYVGGSVLDLLEDLYIASGKNKERTEKGIIILDEFDKLGCVDDVHSSKVRTRDVQQELLGMLGNTTYDLFTDKRRITIDTSKITFVLTGAFQNVFESLKKENKRHSLGFIQEQITGSEVVLKRENLVKIGGIESEILRRIPVIIQMNSLEKDDLKNILEHSEISNLRIWSTALLKEDGINLVWSNEILDEIASRAYEIGGGASGLQSAVSYSLQSITNEVLDGEIYDCDILMEEGISSDPSKYLVKKKGALNELSESNG